MKISIVVPIYNAEKYLESCLCSIRNQTYEKFECLLIDDGSIDKSAEICKRFVSEDSRFIYMKQCNGGVSKARNTGVNYSKGEWITFVDADDMVSSFFLEEAIKYIDDFVDMVIGGTISGIEIENLNPDRNNFGVLYFEKNNIDYLKPHLMANVISICERGYITRGPYCRLIRKNMCKKVSFNENLKLSEDILWNLELIENCKKILVVKQIWYLYRQNMDSKVHKYNVNVINEFDNALSLIYNHIDPTNKKEFFSFCDMLIIDIEIIAKTFICNNLLNLSKRERVKIEKKLYTSEPWIYISKKEYYKYARGKRKVVSLLFKYKLLFMLLRFFH